MNQVPAMEWDLPLNIINGILEKTSKRDLARSRSVASIWCQASEEPRLSEKLRCENLWRSKQVLPIATRLEESSDFRCGTKKDDLIALGGDFSLVCWNTTIGPESYVVLDVGNRVVFSVHFIDKILLSGDYKGELCGWDVDTSKSLLQFKAHSDTLWAIEELREEVATASSDGLIKLWGKGDWKCKKVLRGHPNHVVTLSSTDDKMRLISGSLDIRIWNVAERTCIHVFPGNYGKVIEVSRVFKGLIASRASDEVVLVWDLNDGSVVSKFQGDGDCSCIAMGCGRLVSGSLHGVVSVWDLEQGDCIRKLQTPPDALAFDMEYPYVWLWCDDKMIIGVTDKGTCLMWDFT
ncbi:hypothetical protein BSKO_05513 [Bryopsis sp. KO-2023]|nr:hypothetical protein BSKO_05500 [Bryopsis sp. KO-2023]GMH37636.1 hypothetical protein BSKO_05509 [Bryopsis sp. KO-2023]GMH37640.1 hypothetical protein BSKO_05513 [Bryopsis sp. KO-2023]